MTQGSKRTRSRRRRRAQGPRPLAPLPRVYRGRWQVDRAGIVDVMPRGRRQS